MPDDRPDPPVSATAAGRHDPVDWDAETYHRVSDMQLEGGRRFLAGVELDGDEVVLDAGCGTGRVTKLLLDRVPRGRVIGVDASPSMIERARENLGPEVELHVSNLLEIRLDEPVDVVFSTSTFHWILDHDRLFRVLYDALRPGGRLAAHFGGAGNVERLRTEIGAVARRAPFAEHLAEYEHPWLFASVEETIGRLESTGFEVIRCSAEERLLELADPREWHRTVGMPVQLANLPEELREPYLDAVLDRMPDPGRLRFVRLNIEARRPPS
jgi:trans-aconitate 2-methyltransferase